MPELTTTLLQQEIDYVLTYGDFGGAFESYNIVKDRLEESGLAKSSPSRYRQYRDYLMKLKFLSLEYFNDLDDYYELIKDYFPLALEMDGFDLWSKLEIYLVSVGNLEVRDVFKQKIREALDKSDSLLVNRQKYNNPEMPAKVGEWTKDFIINLGLDSFDKVKKMEYLSSGKFIRLLDKADKEKIKALLDIYEKLMLSSKTKEGYENSVVMNLDGKPVIFNRGTVEEVRGLDEIRKVADAISSDIPVSAPAVASSDVLPDILSDTPSIPAAPASNVPSATISHTAELETMLKNYPPDSLEYKAVSQEILRLKKVAARKNANQ
ncbi:MAG: hypothetical protein WC905_02005 [Patescibacteria group bacterium]|jgi:hypothetical protein